MLAALLLAACSGCCLLSVTPHPHLLKSMEAHPHSGDGSDDADADDDVFGVVDEAVGDAGSNTNALKHDPAGKVPRHASSVDALESSHSSTGDLLDKQTAQRTKRKPHKSVSFEDNSEVTELKTMLSEDPAHHTQQQQS